MTPDLGVIFQYSEFNFQYSAYFTKIPCALKALPSRMMSS